MAFFIQSKVVQFCDVDAFLVLGGAIGGAMFGRGVDAIDGAPRPKGSKSSKKLLLVIATGLD